MVIRIQMSLYVSILCILAILKLCYKSIARALGPLWLRWLVPLAGAVIQGTNSRFTNVTGLTSYVQTMPLGVPFLQTIDHLQTFEGMNIVNI